MVTCAGTLAMVQHPERVKVQMGAILHNIVVFQGSLLSRTLVLISKFIICFAVCNVHLFQLVTSCRNLMFYTLHSV